MADLVGLQFGHYRLIRLLGQGGFADVYLGEHIHPGTLAAIKVLQTRLGGAAMWRSFVMKLASLPISNIPTSCRY